MTSSQPPGPPGHYLLTHLFSISRDPIAFYRQTWEKYGDTVRFHWYGDFYSYLFVGAEGVERVLQSNAQNYSKGFFAQTLKLVLGEGLLSSDGGPNWLRQRRLAQPAFHRQRLGHLADEMTFCAQNLAARWDGIAKGGQPVEILDEMLRLGLEVVGRTLFSTDLDAEASVLMHAFEGCIGHLNHRLNPLTLPERVPSPRNRRFLKNKRILDESVFKIIAARRAGQRRDDLLEMLLEARDEDTGEGMDDTQLRDEVVTLMGAGHETTAGALAWVWLALSLHPATRERLENEVDTVLNGRAATFDDLPKLVWTRQVVDETLRLYPTVWTTMREALQDDVVAGFPIKARSACILSPILTHRHPDYWEAPDTWNPERFAPGEAAKRPKYAYFPFGGGPRLCMGREFALMEMVLVLATIAGQFRLELVGQVPPFASSLTLRPVGGIAMKVNRR